MGTQFREVFEALARTFESHEIKQKPGRGPGSRPFQYITARTAMNRLDDVVGPENWWDDYVPGSRGVLGILTIRLPDGRTVTKQDAGGKAGMEDEGDDDKSGFSDAFKRACVKFGIGRYLYRDGVPTYDDDAGASHAMAPVVAPKALPVRQQPGSGKALWAWAKDSGPALGVDLIEMIKGWAHGHSIDARVTDWDIGTVSDCFADLSARLAAQGKLQGLPPEATPPPTAASGRAPGPMEIESRDPALPLKKLIKEKAKELYRIAFGRAGDQEQVQGYLDLRCLEHKLPRVDNLRNASGRDALRRVLEALEEDFADMGRVASGDPPR